MAIPTEEFVSTERHSFPNREEVRSEPIPEQSREDWDRSHNMDERHRDLERVDGEEVTEQPERPRKEKSSLRQELERQFDAARTGEPQEIEEAVEAEDEPEPQPEPQGTSTAPAAWSRAAKAQWHTLSPDVKHAIWKRELDTEKGVVALKKQYKEIDKALTPYKQVLQQSGKTPAQAVTQIFSWFDALGKDPDAAFPALIEAYKYNPEKMLAKYGHNQLVQLQRAVQPWQQVMGYYFPQVSNPLPAVANLLYIANEVTKQPNPRAKALKYVEMGKKLGVQFNTLQTQQGNGYRPIDPNYREPPTQQQMLEAVDQRLNHRLNHLQRQAAWNHQKGTFEAETNAWKRGKPHIDKVADHMMAAANYHAQQGVLGRLTVAQIGDYLDYIYEQACHAHPEVRKLIQKEQRAAQARKDQEKVNRARHAGSSISVGSPSDEISRGSNRPRKGLSVRESLKQSIAELSER